MDRVEASKGQRPPSIGWVEGPQIVPRQLGYWPEGRWLEVLARVRGVTSTYIVPQSHHTLSVLSLGKVRCHTRLESWPDTVTNPISNWVGARRAPTQLSLLAGG